MREYSTDVLIIGGSFGGVAAAVSVCRAGYKCILTEETDWLGGQATGQGVPLDEHPGIELYGATALYKNFRNRVRDYYRRNYSLTVAAREDEYLNPGACWVSALGFEPRVGMLVIEEMLSPFISAGLLKVWRRTRLSAVHMDTDNIDAVEFADVGKIVKAKYYLDATELGDVIEKGNIERVYGAESQTETGEPLALEEANPQKQQPFTHLIALEYRPDEESDIIEKPLLYDYFKSRFSRISGLCASHRNGRIIAEGIPLGLFTTEEPGKYSPCIWNFRRYLYKGNFASSIFKSDVTSLMVGNEYSEGILCGVNDDERKKHIERAKQLSLSLVYYLQTEAPYGNGAGIPGLKIRTDVFDTDDGLAKYPYIRESCRIRAEYTVKEQDFLVSEHPDGPIPYNDSVGLGGYRIDIHEKAKDANRSITGAAHGKHWAQQIPLGTLIPIRIDNLLAACKNVGTTHVTNGAFRLHPVEWNIGEAAGATAAYCLRTNQIPRSVRNSEDKLADFQAVLIRQGVQLAWPGHPLGQSYYSRMHLVPDWYFGESDKK